MKKIGVIGMILCVVVAAFGFMSYKQTVAETSDTGNFLQKAFAATNADVAGYSIHDWSTLDTQYHSIEQLKALAQKLNRTLNITDAKETIDTSGDQNSYSLRGMWNNGADVELVVKSMKFTDHAPQTALVVTVERDIRDLNEYNQEIQLVRKTALNAKAVPQISTCITGLLADKMKNSDSNALVQRIFRKVDAKEIEGVRSDLVTSVSGYSPLTKDYIVTNGNEMNIQVAVHYDAYEGKTRVVVGSPIVTIEY